MAADDRAESVHSMTLEDILGQIEADGERLLHGQLRSAACFHRPTLAQPDPVEGAIHTISGVHMAHRVSNSPAIWRSGGTAVACVSLRRLSRHSRSADRHADLTNADVPYSSHTAVTCLTSARCRETLWNQAQAEAFCKNDKAGERNAMTRDDLNKSYCSGKAVGPHSLAQTGCDGGDWRVIAALWRS
jgi:hypothetical protein